MRWLCLGLVLLGLTTSAYLLYRSFNLLADVRAEGFDICLALFDTSCDATLADQLSWVLGIPLAGWGVVYYVTLAALLVMTLTLRAAFAPLGLPTALILSLVGLANSAVLAASMLSGTSPFCPLCVVVHVVNFLLPPALFWANGRGARAMLQDLSAAAAYALGRRAAQPTEAAWRVVGLVTVALVSLVAYQWVYVQVMLRQAERIESQPEDVLAEFLAQPANAIAGSSSDIRLGPADAPATLVVFSDFQCPHCARVAKIVSGLQQRYAEQLQVVFKHYPLSSACNTQLKSDLHPRSCALAWAAEAAHLQGKFWAFHDAAFAGDDATFDEAAIVQLARAAGVNLQQFQFDQHSPAVRQKVQRDIELGHELGVRGTPTGYLNGRRVPSLSENSLEMLIEHQLHPRTDKRAFAPSRESIAAEDFVD